MDTNSSSPAHVEAERAQGSGRQPVRERARPGPAMAALFAIDTLRAAWEFGGLFATWPWLARAPRGDGHAVLVLPGLLSDDSSTLPLRAFLAERGYDAHGWDLGRNRGRWDVLETLLRRVEALRAGTDGKVSLVGWSMGGLYAREIARRRPHDVRALVQIGTPFTGAAGRNPNWWLYELTSGCAVEATQLHGRTRPPPPVPVTSIYSRSDGQVYWRHCVEADAEPARSVENVEVVSSHRGLVHHPHVLWIVADRLAQPDGGWRPYRAEPPTH